MGINWKEILTDTIFSLRVWGSALVLDLTCQIHLHFISPVLLKGE